MDIYQRADMANARRRVAIGRRLLAIATMLAGAVASAWLVLNVSPLSGLSLATALLAVVAIGAALAASRPGTWRAAPPPPAKR